jgi:hypothetical protein
MVLSSRSAEYIAKRSPACLLMMAVSGNSDKVLHEMAPAAVVDDIRRAGLRIVIRAPV